MTKTCLVGDPPCNFVPKKLKPPEVVKQTLKRPMTTAEIAEATGYDVSWTRKVLRSMLKAGLVVQSITSPAYNATSVGSCIDGNWIGDDSDKTMLARGLVHGYQAAAEAHARALIALTESKS